MQAIIHSAIDTLKEHSSALLSGKHSVDYTLSLIDNVTDEEFSVSVSGVVTKGEQESVTPTTSIPWVTVAAELLRSCGVTGDSAILRLRSALEAVLTQDKSLSAELKDTHKSVAVAVEKIKTELLAKLPKTTREGKTSFATIQSVISVPEGVSCEA